MTTERPLPDRCGARVTDKVGAEIVFDDATVAGADDETVGTLTDADVGAIRLVGPENKTDIDAEPEYEQLREYLWSDFVPTHVCLRPDVEYPAELDGHLLEVEAPPGAEKEAGDPLVRGTWYRCESTPDVSNRTSELQGFCERWPMSDSERCYNHQGGGAPEGNTNAITHGLYAQRTNFYQVLDTEEKQFVESLVDQWIEMSPYERDNTAVINDLYRCAIDQIRAWYGVEEFADASGPNGLTEEQEVFDGEDVHEIVEEHPANLPYSRLDRDVQDKLKKLDVYNKSEKQQAEATMSLAQKLSGMGDDE